MVCPLLACLLACLYAVHLSPVENLLERASTQKASLRRSALAAAGWPVWVAGRRGLEGPKHFSVVASMVLFVCFVFSHLLVLHSTHGCITFHPTAPTTH
jgi:hypothetical protein